MLFESKRYGVHVGPIALGKNDSVLVDIGF
jgi:hypothetical protein